MIYVVEMSHPNSFFNGPKLPPMRRTTFIETFLEWPELEGFLKAVRNGGPGKLVAHCQAIAYDGDAEPWAVGQLVTPHRFFYRPWPQNKAEAALVKYKPIDDVELYMNLDGDYYYVNAERGRCDGYAANEESFAALTKGIVDQLWSDWHRFPPMAPMQMQHFATECQQRGLA